MANYIQLKSQIEKLQKEAEILRKRERAKAIASIKEAIAAYELTPEDLGPLPTAHSRKTGKGDDKVTQPGRNAKKKSAVKTKFEDKRRKVAPKYRDSATGTTWTGRGKQPKWLSAAIKGGKKLEDFKI